MNLTDGESGLPEVTRRTWLAAVGTSVAVAAGATGTGSADEHGYGGSGYGAGPYGGQNTTETVDTALGVSTVGAANTGPSSATLTGDLTELQGAEQAAVFFEYGPSNEGLPNSTAEQTLDSTVEFETTATGLASDTEYEVRAVARADGEVATGGTATFITQAEQTADPAPTVERLTGSDESNDRNPHVDAELSWAASITDGEIYAAELTLSGPDGLIETWEYDLSGPAVDRTETDRIPLGAREAGTEYTVDLTVYSYSGEYDTATATFNSQ